MNRIVFILFVFWGFVASAQTERGIVRDGNKQYKKGNYKKAQESYVKAIEKNKNLTEAYFNAGDALYKQNKFEEAGNYFNYLTQQKISKEQKAKAFHNLGNTYMKQKKLQEAVTAYQNSLINNPKDNDTKFNLAYAQMLMKQQQQKNKNDKNKKDDKKKDQDKKQDQQNQNQDKKDNQQKQQPKPKPGEMSKEDAERMLQAIDKNEKETQDKLKKERVKGAKVKIEKDL